MLENCILEEVPPGCDEVEIGVEGGGGEESERGPTTSFTILADHDPSPLLLKTYFGVSNN